MILMAVSIGLGAFGAHVLREQLILSGRKETFELGIRYFTYHSLALVILGALTEKFRGLRISALFLVIGVILFSGSLLTLALTNQPMWGAVAPLGGSAFIAGWLHAAWVVYESAKLPE